jgi:hypothetical protein
MGLGSDQLDLYAVNWLVLQNRPEPVYSAALLAYANGALLGMPNEEIDLMVKTLLEQFPSPLDPWPPLNAFKKLFMLFPYDDTQADADLQFLMELDDRGWKAANLWVKTWHKYKDARAQLFHTMADAAQLTEQQRQHIIRNSGWTDEQKADALAAAEKAKTDRLTTGAPQVVEGLDSKPVNVLVLIVLAFLAWRMFR